jgi:hypothetical protein
MIDGRSKEVSRSWVMLCWFIENAGMLSITDIRKKIGRRGNAIPPSLGNFRKMKQNLCGELKILFGMTTDPIRAAGPQTYQTRFLVRNSDPRSAGARRVL